MSSSYCTSDTCNNGNCQGCRNGELWCDDPRCSPYCQSCEMPDDFDYLVNVLFIVIIVGLVILILCVLFMYGPRFRNTPPVTSPQPVTYTTSSSNQNLYLPLNATSINGFNVT